MCGWLVGLLGIKSSFLPIFDPILGFLEKESPPAGNTNR